jgi:hypothetical protein
MLFLVVLAPTHEAGEEVELFDPRVPHTVAPLVQLDDLSTFRALLDQIIEMLHQISQNVFSADLIN